MTSEEKREIATMGGYAASRDRARMAEIGRKGGEASGRNRRAKAEAAKAGLQPEQSSEA